MSPGEQIILTSRRCGPGNPAGGTTFYQRARRKLRLTDSAEIPAQPVVDAP